MERKVNFSKLFLAALLTLTSSIALAFEAGETYVLKTNLHPDANKRVLYTMNYNLPSLMPMCAEIEVVKKSKKKMMFTWKGVEYTMVYDKHTKKAGVSFDDALSDSFGESCDSEKVKSMSEVDQKGIRKGLPYVGMSRQGIIYAMGRPPRHANPDLDAYTYMYWINRFKRKAIDFDDKGIVEEVRL